MVLSAMEKKKIRKEDGKERVVQFYMGLVEEISLKKIFMSRRQRSLMPTVPQSILGMAQMPLYRWNR